VHHPIHKTWDRPFQSFATIMGGCARILWYGFLTSAESMRELKPHLEKLGQRIRGLNVSVVVVYVAKCCGSGSYGSTITEVCNQPAPMIGACGFAAHFMWCHRL
jgi:hypothetical protein